MVHMHINYDYVYTHPYTHWAGQMGLNRYQRFQHYNVINTCRVYIIATCQGIKLLARDVLQSYTLE